MSDNKITDYTSVSKSNHKILKFITIILSILIVICLFFLIIGFINKFGELEKKTIEEIEKYYISYNHFLSNIDIRKASQELRNIWVIGNEYLQKSQPWAIFKNEENKTRMIIRFSFNLIYFYSLISEPFIP